MIILQSNGALDAISQFIDNTLADNSLISGTIFSATRGYIYGMIRNFGLDGFGNIQQLLLSAIAVYLTLWFIYQGWQIATGRNQENLTRFAQKSLITLLLVWIALLGSHKAANIVDFIDGLQGIVTTAIAGDNYQNPEKLVDNSLIMMQLMSNKLETYVNKDDTMQMADTGRLFISSMGVALPALISGGLLLLNKAALYLCVMFASLCLVAYIFEQTRFMFTAWAKFTVTTLFSLAVITIITIIAMKAVLFVTAALMLAEMTGGADLKSIATAQGGVGMLISTLVIGMPPLITNFFSGQVAAAFQGYNPVSGLAGGGAASSPQDLVNKRNTQPTAENETDVNRQPVGRVYNAGTPSTQNSPPSGTRGNAKKDPE